MKKNQFGACLNINESSLLFLKKKHISCIMFAICAKKLAKKKTGVCSTHACEAVTEHKSSIFLDEPGDFNCKNLYG